ncbi:Succinate dehydrogenase iron-sulfur subunit [Planctomycetales bacterium 10988]|nr:Succinate dehydrogenase iron-sulfur subunit [Planctomycetales bacterium 10988]
MSESTDQSNGKSPGSSQPKDTNKEGIPPKSPHGQGDHGDVSNKVKEKPKSLYIRILRQDSPEDASYWERHTITYEPELNMTTVLQRVAAQAKTADGKDVTPVAYDVNCLEEICGSCTMLINGRVRQACSTLVDNLLQENAEEIVLEPMSKFPVIRDLFVDRSRMFHALKKIQGWINVDGYWDAGEGPKQSPAEQQDRYPLSQCMTCGCCLEACPQYTKIEVERGEGESDEAYEDRCREAYSKGFLGAAAISQVVLFNLHPTGKMRAGERLDALSSEGGLQVCGNAQNCVSVCPKSIPLTTSIGRAGRATTVHAIKRFFGF